jgi:hypothetical protein
MIGPTLADLLPQQPMWTVSPDYGPLLKCIAENQAKARADALREAAAIIKPMQESYRRKQVRAIEENNLALADVCGTMCSAFGDSMDAIEGLIEESRLKAQETPAT